MPIVTNRWPKVPLTEGPEVTMDAAETQKRSAIEQHSRQAGQFAATLSRFAAGPKSAYR